MKVLVIGASGLIGSHLMKACSQRGWLTAGTFSEHPQQGLVRLEMTDRASVKSALKETDPDAIFLTAFNPNVEYCEAHPEETRRVNVEGNAHVIEEASRLGKRIVYYSSDYVFDGERGPYRESDAVNPINEYGRQKQEVERLVASAKGNHLIIRTTTVYGWEERRKNFFCHLLDAAEKGEKMKIATDQISTPTLAEDLAEASCRLVEADVSGIVHVAGPDCVSRFAFAKAITKIFALPYQDLLIPLSTAEMGQPAPRPLKAGLVSERLPSLGITMRGIAESLSRLKTSKA